MQTRSPKSEMLRAGIARGIGGEASGIDRETGTIRGFSVITQGEARGHGMQIDSKTLDQVVELGNKSKVGLKSRFGHPNMSNDALGTFLGRATNFRRDGEQVRADLKLDETAFATPNGDLASYVLGLAETDPSAFATSIVFAGDREEQDDGDPIARVEKLFAVDVVDEGAANSGMFGAQFFTGQVELSAAGTKALDKLLDQPDAADKILSFLERYSARREGPKPAETNAKEPAMAETVVAPITAEQFDQINAELSTTKASLSASAAEGRALAASAANEAIKAERQRIAAIRKAAFSGQAALVDQAIEDGSTVEQAMASFIDAEKLANAGRLKAFRTNTVPAVGPSADIDGDVVPEVDLTSKDFDEISLTARWEKDPALRSEFLQNKASFLAYCKAASRGQVKLDASKK